MSLLSDLRALIDGAPPGAVAVTFTVTVAADALRAELDAASAAHPPVSFDLLDCAAMAARAGVSESTLRSYMRADLIPGAFRLNGTGPWRCPPAAFDAWRAGVPAPAPDLPEPTPTTPAPRPSDRLDSWRSVRRPATGGRRAHG
jgi:hypothetical protein